MLRNVLPPQMQSVRAALVSCVPTISAQNVRKTNVSAGKNSREQVKKQQHNIQPEIHHTASKQYKIFSLLIFELLSLLLKQQRGSEVALNDVSIFTDVAGVNLIKYTYECEPICLEHAYYDEKKNTCIPRTM